MARSGPASPAPISVIVSDESFMCWTVFSRSVSAASGLVFEDRSRFPQLRKDFLVERKLEIRTAGGASCAFTCADGAFHHLDVAQAPAHDELIELCQTFANVDPVAVIVLVTVKRADGFGTSLETFSLRCVLAQHRQCSHRFQGLEENVTQGVFAKPAMQNGMRFGGKFVV